MAAKKAAGGSSKKAPKGAKKGKPLSLEAMRKKWKPKGKPEPHKVVVPASE